MTDAERNYMYLQDDGEEKQLCDNCKKTDKSTVAERYCIKCEEKVCVSCGLLHHHNKEEHLVVALYEQKEAKKFKESNECVFHHGKLAELYCACCRMVICGVCEKESHSSHNCSRVEDVADSISKQAETEYENLSYIQSHFEEERKKLFEEKVRTVKTIKEMEADIRRRCVAITEFVYNETNALLAELDAFRRERLEEIEIERKKVEEHAFAFDKFKEYCEQIMSNAVPKDTCESETVLRNIADDLKTRPEGRWKGRLFSIQFSLQKTDMDQMLTTLSDAVGKLRIRCPYKMANSSTVNFDVGEVYDMARLHDKLYLLSNSIFIRRLQHPFSPIEEIKIPEMTSPKEIVSCTKTSCLYIYDKDADCVWKVSVPDHRVSLWLDKVKKPGALSVTSNAELLILRNSKPVCLEVYNEHAILVRRLKLPANIPCLSSLYETSSGKYYGIGEQGVFALRRDGSIISQFKTSSWECHGNPRCFHLSPYNIFLHCSSHRSFVCSSGSISSLTFDFASRQSLEEGFFWITPVTSCYVKETKQLLVLEGAGKSLTLKIYDVFPE